MEYMTKILAKYETLRGKEQNEWKMPFWDAVIITAANQLQKNVFSLQIAEKKRLKEIPIFDEYHVFADSGPKIGCGGSTLLALKKMAEMYGNNMHTMKILLIHAGGQSQRLPCHSCLGKLFALLPLGHPSYHVLDLKLAMYLPFLDRMKPGIFLTASDDIITYDLELNPHWSFKGDGFTVLAHPSPLDVATTHGVYVLSSDQSECIRVLQKPSLSLLQETGAIVTDIDGHQWAYTDSAYFFDYTIANKLLEFANEWQPRCEVDAYGDFLQPLGSQPSEKYLECGGELGSVRRKLYDTLKGSTLHVVILDKSTFYHLGTMQEYVRNLTSCIDLSKSLGICKRSFSSPTNSSETIQGTIMHSILHPKSTIGCYSVLEYCDFQIPVIFEEGIMSNCQLTLTCDSEKPVHIPSSTFFYTVPCNHSTDVRFVTVAFHLDDDIKKSCGISECGELKYMNANLRDIIADTESCFQSTGMCSLWNAKLFQPCSTRDESFRSTLRLVENPKDVTNETSMVSMEDVLTNANFSYILDFHNDLRQKISKL